MISIKPLQQIDVGAMRHRVRLQSNVASQSSSGARVTEWEDFAEVWASIEPLGGRELFAAAQIYPESPTTITIRYLDGVDPAMRVLWNDPRTNKDVAFDIQNISDTEERHYVLELTALQRPSVRAT